MSIDEALAISRKDLVAISQVKDAIKYILLIPPNDRTNIHLDILSDLLTKLEYYYEDMNYDETH